MKAFNRTGIVCQQGSVVGLTVAGVRSLTAVAAPVAEAEGAAPAQLAGALAALRENAGHPPGELRCILPVEACENFLRVLSGSPSGEEVRERCLRWVEDEYGVDLASSDAHVSAYAFGDARVGVVTVARRGLLGEYVREAAAHGLGGVAFVSPLDALMETAGQSAQTPGLAAFLHVAPESTLVLILDNGVPVFFRGISRSLDIEAEVGDRYEAMRPSGPPMRRLTSQAVGEIVDEFARTVGFYKRSHDSQGDLERVVVTTGGLDARPVAALAQETLRTKAEPAAPPSALRIEDALAKEGLIGDNWGQFALSAAVAAPVRIRPKRCLARVAGPLDRLFTPQAAFAAAACAFGLAMALWLAFAWTTRAGLESRKTTLEAKRDALQRDLTQRRSDYGRRAQYRRAARMLLRMKEQGVFASGILAALNNERPVQELRFDRLSVALGEDVARTELTVALSGKLAATGGLVHLIEYAARLGQNPRFSWVSAPAGTADDALPDQKRTVPTAAATGETTVEPAPETARRILYTLMAESAAPWIREDERWP